MATHLLIEGATKTACGIDRKTAGELTWTLHKFAVSCVDCQLTEEYARAIQRIPTIRGGPYKHGV